MKKIPLILISILWALSSHALERSAVLKVQNMTCALCPITVKKSLEKVEGVQKVSVSFDDKTATIVFDDDKSDVLDLIDATTNAGYPSSEAEE